ncbi:AmmeMemoRadiSam system protein B [Shewanella aquimarina]|uniref:AmmeMemoRadiSam system protein B n=1 Tax=Shewanella aquimarina TaxID=260365 RepID=UPI002014ADEE|nr:AmmeMemoRadiSam system protein B [Shewanella aquimarina]MCL2911828.1 AmmeMemoRadiSam system protein B [Shewanella aquimarina]
MRYREPAVAGRFYPDNPGDLIQQIANYFDQPNHSTIVPKAIIAPHAGYFYSGAIAAAAYRLLANKKPAYNKVLLLGPSHYVGLSGAALPRSDRFITPMGEVAIDRELVEALLYQRLAIESDTAHQQEHALEVQLPLLQYCLSDFSLVPVVVGDSGSEAISKLIKATLSYAPDRPAPLVVVSSDLSHYHPYPLANRLDQETRSTILALDTHLTSQQACGCHAINGLLDYGKQQGWQIQCVSHANSGDIMAHNEHRAPRDNEEVVGYASFVLY